MKIKGGFLVTKIKQLGDRIFERILNEKNAPLGSIERTNILFVENPLKNPVTKLFFQGLLPE